MVLQLYTVHAKKRHVVHNVHENKSSVRFVLIKIKAPSPSSSKSYRYTIDVVVPELKPTLDIKYPDNMYSTIYRSGRKCK
jgi:hypothetical protein